MQLHDAFRRGEVPEIAGEDSFVAMQLALLAQEAAERSGTPVAWER